MFEMIPWIVIGITAVIFLIFFLLVIWSLCAMAAQSDDQAGTRG